MTPPILGIFASAVTGGVSTSSFESIATVTVGSGGASTITFSSIPGTYTHLQIRGIGRSSNGGAPDNIYARINSDSSTNYSNHYLWGNGTVAQATGGSNNDLYIAGRQTGNDSLSNTFGATVIDILDYANTNKYKTIRYLAGWDTNGAGEAWFASANWRSTSAITSLTCYNSFNWVQYSHFALYGIKAAA
jgi:hypothetical protein